MYLNHVSQSCISIMYLNHGIDDFHGGLCTVAATETKRQGDREVTFVEIEERSPGKSWMLWETYLEPKQESLKVDAEVDCVWCKVRRVDSAAALIFRRSATGEVLSDLRSSGLLDSRGCPLPAANRRFIVSAKRLRPSCVMRGPRPCVWQESPGSTATQSSAHVEMVFTEW